MITFVFHPLHILYRHTYCANLLDKSILNYCSLIQQTSNKSHLHEDRILLEAAVYGAILSTLIGIK